MINKNSIEASIGLASKLSSKGILLRPIEGTPLASLVKAGYLPRPEIGDVQMSIEEGILKGSVCKDLQGVCQHDVVMDEVVEVIARTVEANLDVARNQVNPTVKAVVEYTQAELEATEKLKATTFSVSLDTYSSIWDSPVLADMVERYADTSVEDLRLDKYIPKPENLADLAMTGASRFDKELQTFFESVDEEFLSNSYSVVFGDRAEGFVSTSLVNSVNIYTENRDAILLRHLFARKLLNNPPEGVEMGLAQYNEYISTIMAQTGRAVSRILSRRETDRVQKVLVRSFPLMGIDRIGLVPIDIRVNSDVYMKWLEEGGSPEVLFGAFVTDREQGYTTLLNNKDHYINAWRRQERVLHTAIRMDRNNNAAYSLVKALYKQIDEMPEEDLLLPKVVYKDKIDACVADLPARWYEDMFCSVRKIVCSAIYPHTDAYAILTAIDNAANDNPGIDIREAGYLAVIEIVSAWVAKLMNVEAVPT